MATTRASRFRLLPAVLVAAALAAGCDDELAPLFAVDGEGSVEGLVFFDASEDGVFDPSDGDYPVEGVTVAVQERGTGRTFSGAEETTGPDGRFVVTGVPVGTHDLVIDETTVPAEVSICQNPVNVTVNEDETRFVDVAGRPGCLITIEEAKELPIGEFAIVRGIVTSFPGQIESSFTYIQDGSAGAKIFSSALEGQGIQVGDQIEIGGVAEVFSGDFNFEDVTLRAVTPDVGELSPETVTTAEVAASGSTYTHPLQGAFIRIEGAEVMGAFDGQNVTIDDGSGATIMRVDDGVADRNQLDTLFPAGTCYDINGFGANFNGTGQIFPRSLDDIEEVPCS